MARKSSLLESFNWAFEGVVHALRRERNMWIHFGTAVLVLVAALFFSLTRLEVVALFVAISFVLITEMLNTAIEHVVDLVTDELDPRAKIAKDVAAGAVLVATINALAVVVLVLVILAAVIVKALTHRGSAFRGGMPSVHAAVAFAGWVAVTVFATRTAYALPISAIGLFMAVLVAQSRVQAGIHTTTEVALGALLGVGISVLVFQLWYPL